MKYITAEDAAGIIVENSGFDCRTIRENSAEAILELSWYGEIGEMNRHTLYINYDRTLQGLKNAIINANETYPAQGEYETVTLIRDPARYRPQSLINLGKELEDNIQKVNSWTKDIIEAIENIEWDGPGNHGLVKTMDPETFKEIFGKHGDKVEAPVAGSSSSTHKISFNEEKKKARQMQKSGTPKKNRGPVR